MQCPVDGETLQMSERQGIEIDYCPRCRGVWLDRGELDKIIQRSDDDDDDDDRYDRDRDDRYGLAERPRYEQQQDPRYQDPRYQDPRYQDPRYGHRRKKKSFLSEMFEFGD